MIDTFIPAIQVLVLGDRPEVLNALARTQPAARLQAVAAPTKGDALRLLRETDFSVVMLDLPAAGEDGLELFRAIRQDAPFVPIVILVEFNDILRGVAVLKEVPPNTYSSRFNPIHSFEPSRE